MDKGIDDHNWFKRFEFIQEKESPKRPVLLGNGTVSFDEKWIEDAYTMSAPISLC
ncbi:MAG TPA: hypothetical protein VEG44_04700 [Candidatus Acidoferrales bacterium]|nr:hypothetical protein [Candidatus Acidoferrales bacterium]